MGYSILNDCILPQFRKIVEECRYLQPAGYRLETALEKALDCLNTFAPFVTGGWKKNLLHEHIVAPLSSL